MTKVDSIPSTTEPKFKFTKRNIALVAVIALVLQFLIFTVALPLMQSDGLEKFTGAKRAAAQEVLELVKTNELDNKSRWGYRVFVEDVYPTPHEACTSPDVTSTGPNDPRHYTVVVRIKPLLSYSAGDKEIHPGCNKYW